MTEVSASHEVTSSFTFSPLRMIDLSVPEYARNLYIFIGTIGSIGNLFVFSILFKYLSQYPSLTEILLLHQSIVDEITSIIVILIAIFPSSKIYSNTPNIWEDFICRFWATQVMSAYAEEKSKLGTCAYPVI